MQTLYASVAAIALSTTACVAQAQQDPYLTPDNAWISLTGTADITTEGAIVLNYGDGMVVVEVDDRDAFDEADLIDAGDRIYVTGYIDDDFFEVTKIEADTIYFYDTGVLYDTTISPDDEEGGANFAVVSAAYAYPATPPKDGSHMSVTGRVTAVEGEEFTLQSNWMNLRVDTGNLPYEADDDVGGQFVKVGDIVRATGVFDAQLLERNELQAFSLVTLRTAPRKADAEDES